MRDFRELLELRNEQVSTADNDSQTDDVSLKVQHAFNRLS